MSADPEVIRAIEAALAADENNVALRSHLAAMMVETRPEDALVHAQKILQSEPTHRDALQTAVTAARATGRKDLADGYGKLLDALKWSNAANMLGSELAGKTDNDPISDADEGEDEDEGERHRLYADGESDKMTSEFMDVEVPRLTLNDVAGMLSVKKRLDLAFLAPLKNPELRKMYGKSLRGGLLLYGPPGCGKTYIARALAGEMGMKFLNISLNDVMDPYMGVSENKLHALFEEARRIQPVILFFDELDALGRKRSLMRESSSRNIVNQLLAELDGIDMVNEGLFTIAATNHPWDIDAALRRPGRFDRVVFVPPPDAPARKAIVQLNLDERPHDKIDFDKIAKDTDHFSGADMAHLVDSAAELALSDAIERGKVRPIDMNDFKKALREIRPSTRAWFDTAKNYAIYANEGGSYDPLIEFMREKKMI